MPRRLIALIACAAALPLAACGQEEDGVLVGETEGIYIDIGEVKYQVQLSRILNERSPEDAPLMVGIPEQERRLDFGEVWFAVWVRAENEGREVAPRVEDFEIKDTLGERHEPIEFGPEAQTAWVNQARTVGPEGTPSDRIPRPDSPADQTSPQGGLVLFKLDLETLENRPLQFEITSPSDSSVVGEVDLDV